MGPETIKTDDIKSSEISDPRTKNSAGAPEIYTPRVQISSPVLDPDT